MPLYEYRCLSCGERSEVLQRLGAEPLASCPRCGGAVEKVISASALQFKGSGWYVTDYAGKGSAAADKGSDAGQEKAGGDAKSEGTPAAKPEAKKAESGPAAPPSKD